MVSDEFIVKLNQDDLCGILTVDGEFYDIFYPSHRRILKRADQVQEWMTYLMKFEEHNQGVWLWTIKKNAEEIEGMCLDDTMDDLHDM